MVKQIKQSSDVERYTNDEIKLILDSFKGISDEDRIGFYEVYIKNEKYPKPPSEIKSILVKQLAQFLTPQIGGPNTEGDVIMSSHNVEADGVNIGFNTPYKVTGFRESKVIDRTSYVRNYYDIYPMDRISSGHYSSQLQHGFLFNKYYSGATILPNSYEQMYDDVLSAFEYNHMIHTRIPPQLELPQPLGDNYKFDLDTTLLNLLCDSFRYKKTPVSTEAFLYDLWDSSHAYLLFMWMEKRSISEEISKIAKKQSILSQILMENSQVKDTTILMLNYNVISQSKFDKIYPALNASQRKQVIEEHKIRTDALRAPLVYSGTTFSKLWSDRKEAIRAFKDLLIQDSKNNTNLQDNICQHKWDEIQDFIANKSQEEIEKKQRELYVNRVMADTQRKVQRHDLFCKICGELLIKQKLDLMDDISDAAAVFVVDEVSRVVHKTTLMILTKYITVNSGKLESHAAIVRDLVINILHDTLDKILVSNDAVSNNLINIYITTYAMASLAVISLNGSLAIKEVKLKRGGATTHKGNNSITDEKMALTSALAVCYDRLTTDMKATNMNIKEIRKMLIKAYTIFRKGANSDLISSELDDRVITIMGDPIYLWISRIRGIKETEVERILGLNYEDNPPNIFANIGELKSPTFNLFMKLYNGNMDYKKPEGDKYFVAPRAKDFTEYKPVRDFIYNGVDDGLFYDEIGNRRKWNIAVVNINGKRQQVNKDEIPKDAKILEWRSTDGSVKGKVDSNKLNKQIVKYERKVGFYTYYKYKCPVKTYHEGSPCKWCKFIPDYALNLDDSYFNKYDNNYEKIRTPNTTRITIPKTESHDKVPKYDVSYIKRVSDIFNVSMENLNNIGYAGDKALALLSYNGLVVSYYSLANTKMVPLEIYDLGIKTIENITFIPPISNSDISNHATSMLSILCQNILLIYKINKKLATTMFNYILSLDDRYGVPNMIIVKQAREEERTTAVQESGALAESYETEENYVKDDIEAYYEESPDYDGAEEEEIDFEFD